MKLADHWPPHDGDGCAEFMSHIVKAADITVPDDARVLEIGSAEFDWLSRARNAFPSMTIEGVDWRDSLGKKANALDTSLYEPESFDLIVSISAVEHFGLGHYEEDPLDEDGDTHIIANAFRWLKVGGWLLFDVPFTPQAYTVQGTSHREYNDDAVWMRLWVEPLAQAKARAFWKGDWYSSGEKPKEHCSPFVYAGFCWQKIG